MRASQLEGGRETDRLEIGRAETSEASAELELLLSKIKPQLFGRQAYL